MARIQVRSKEGCEYITAGKWYNAERYSCTCCWVTGDNGLAVLVKLSGVDAHTKDVWQYKITECVNDEPLHRLTKVGDTFYNHDGVKLKVVGSCGCLGCAYEDTEIEGICLKACFRGGNINKHGIMFERC